MTMIKSFLEPAIQESQRLLTLLPEFEPQLQQASTLLKDCLLKGNKILACGNGGSASDSAHMVAEFVGRFMEDRASFPAIPLAADPAIVTSIANDYTFDEVFARQVQGYSQPGDVLVVFSTSGNSSNIVKALQAARKHNLHSLAFLGRDGGKCKNLATVELIIPSSSTARIQEFHKLLLHVLCHSLEPHLQK